MGAPILRFRAPFCSPSETGSNGLFSSGPYGQKNVIRTLHVAYRRAIRPGRPAAYNEVMLRTMIAARSLLATPGTPAWSQVARAVRVPAPLVSAPLSVPVLAAPLGRAS